MDTFAVSQGIRSLLIGANLDIKFCPYTFLHVLCIQNALPGAGQTDSPIFNQQVRKIISKIFELLDVGFGFVLPEYDVVDSKVMLEKASFLVIFLILIV